MRIRTIKPEFWSHPVMCRLAPEARLLALGLLNLADDDGYFLADPAIVRGSCMPYVDSIPKISGWMRDLSRAGWIELCETTEHGILGRVRKWTEHQRLDHPKPGNLKGYWTENTNTENFGIDTENFSGERKGRERKGKEQGEATTNVRGNSIDVDAIEIPPDLSQLSEHIKTFALYRKEDLRKPFTPRAFAEFLKQVRTMHEQRYDIASLVSKAIASNWKTIYANANDHRREETADEAAFRICEEAGKK